MKKFFSSNNILAYLLGLFSAFLFYFAKRYELTKFSFENIENLFLYIITILICLTFFYKKIIEKYPETQQGLNYVYAVSLSIFLLAYFIISNQSLHNYQTSLAVLISSLFLGTGWWVQAMISQSSARRAHTVNVIMNQRNNTDFNNNLKTARNILSTTKVVNPELVNYFLNKDSVKLRNDISQENKDKLKNIEEGIASLQYLLNYYEFIAAGVNSKDLDIELISSCFSGILEKLELRAFYLIYTISKNHDGEKYPYCELLQLIQKCSPTKTSIALNAYNTKNSSEPSIPIPHTYVLSEKEISEIFES